MDEEVTMSIYATGWELRLAVGHGWPSDKWVEVYAQFVPAHIGRPEEGYTEDPYADFLPPVVPESLAVPSDDEEEIPHRAIVVVQRGHEKKDGQKYINPVLTMSYVEYKKMTFDDFLSLIYSNLKEVK